MKKDYSSLSERKYIYCDILKKAIDSMLEKEINLKTGEIKVHREVLKEILPVLIENDCYNPILKYIDYSEVSFDDLDVTNKKLKGINAKNIDPQTVKHKNLSNTNLKGIDMSDKNFDNTYIRGTNLENTNAHIHLDKVNSIEGTKLNGCYVYINIDEPKEKNIQNYKDIEDAVFISESKNKDYNHQYMPMALVKKFIKTPKS